MPIKQFLNFLRQTDGGIKTRSIRAGIWLGFSNLILTSQSFVRSIILARLLTPEIFGLWAICMIFVRGVDVFTATGFAAALIYKQEGFEEARNTAFSLTVLRGVLLALLTLVLGPLFAFIFEQQIIASAISTLSITFLFLGFRNINTIYHQKELNFKALVVLEQAATMINFILVILFVYLYRNIWGLVVAHVASCLAHVILSYLLVPGKPKFAFDKKIALELFHYGKFITGLSVVVFITSEIDNAVIGKVLGMEQLGFYVLAYTLANLPATQFTKILSKILFPAFSKMQKDFEALKLSLFRSIKFVALVTIPLSVIFFVLADELISILYGDQWRITAEALRFLAVFGCLRAISSINGYLYNAIGKPKIPFYLNLSKLAIIASIIIPATELYGILGAAVAITVPQFFQFFISFHVICKILKAGFWSMLTPVLKATFTSIIMGVFIFFFKTFFTDFDIISLIFVLSAAAIVYSVMNLRDIKELIALLYIRS